MKGYPKPILRVVNCPQSALPSFQVLDRPVLVDKARLTQLLEQEPHGENDAVIRDLVARHNSTHFWVQ